MFVVIGTTTVDLLMRGMPALGELGDGFRASNLVFCDQPLEWLMGGNGGNAAFVCGRLGVPTAVCSSVGQDAWGEWLGQTLAAEGVNVDGLVRQPHRATSTSVILQAGDERQVVLHHRGATDEMGLTAVHTTLCSRATALLISSYTLFSRLRSGGFAQALGLTRAAGGTTALDIGPAIGQPATLDELVPLFPDLDYLIANVHELLVCTGAGDWETAVAILLAHGCRCVVVKQGADGVALRSPDLVLDVPALPVTVNISIGAGDAFNAGFLVGLHTTSTADRPQQLLKALHFGNVTAALIVTGQHGILSAPTLAQVINRAHL